MIDKKIHLYWGRKKPLSYLRYLTVETLSELNPGWDIIVYTAGCDNEVVWQTGEQEGEYTGKDYFKELDKHATIKVIEDVGGLFRGAKHDNQRGDIVRWWALLEFGGIWSDFDVVYFKELPDAIKKQECTVCFNPQGGYWSVGLMGGDRGHPFYAEIFERAQNVSSKNYQGYGVELLSGAGINGFNYEMYNLPMDVVYYHDSYNIEKIFEDSPIGEGAIGIHWYAGSPITRAWENRITPENLGYDNLICKKIRQVKGRG